MEEEKIERQEPWLTEGANELLETFFRANNNTHVLEVGMGASTVWLAKRCRLFTSIEHDRSWFTSTMLKLLGNRIVDTIAIPEGFSVPVNGMELFNVDRPYNIIIDRKPDEYFDLVLIDGRDRAKCIRSAIPKLRAGGWLILDNSEREYYQPGIDLMKDWNRIDCRQQRPDKYGFTYPDWTTSIFIKP